MGRRKSMMETMTPERRKMAEEFLQSGQPPRKTSTSDRRENENIDRSDPSLSASRASRTLMPERTFVSRTYRLAPHLVGTLNAAASERALERTYPYTREDILHEALSDWFKKQGYLSA